MSDLTGLDRLPLGRMVRLLEDELTPFRLLPNGEMPDSCENGVKNVYRRFDEQLGRRPDYKLWRTLLIPHFSIGKQWLDQPKSQFISEAENPLQEFGRICAESDDPVVLWSTIAITATILDDRRAIRPVTHNHKALMAISDRLYARLRYELDPLPDCQASCGIAAAHFLVAHQRFHYNLGFAIGANECSDFVNLLGRWLLKSDPLWVPGQKLSLSAVEAERKGQHRLRPGHDSYEFSLLTNMLSRVRPIISMNTKKIERETFELFRLSHQYALTAWLTARSRRHDEVLHQNKIGKFESHRSLYKRRTALLKELDCLWNASNAARDAGEFLESSKLCYLFYRLVPDEFAHDKLVIEEIKKRTATIRYLKEVGLELDQRFLMDDSTPEWQAHIADKASHHFMLWNARLGLPPEFSSQHGDGWTGFALRVLHDQQTHPAWAVLLNATDIPGGKQSPAGYMFTVIRGLGDNRFPASPKTLIAAYELALEYGYIRSAGKILARAVERDEFPIDAKLLMDFVHHVKRCTQLDPFGMRHERIAKWQELIVSACIKLVGEHGRNWLSADDRVWLHELLLNRTLVHHRSLSLANTRRLYQKAIGVFEIEDLREFYDNELNLLRRYPGIANTKTIKKFCARYRNSDLGAPVAISSALLGEFLSVVGIGQDDTSTENIFVGDLDAAIRSLQADSAHWFGMADVEVDEQIHWPNAFRAMCRSIAKVAASCDPNSRVIIISCDWFIAQFPLQHLFQAEGFDYLIAIVPNFSSIGLDRRDQPQQRDLRLELSTEKDTAISKANEAVCNTTAGIDWRGSSVCIVVGHGSKISEGGLPSVRIGQRSEDQFASSIDWISVLDSRIVILHCCHGGVPTPMVMQELGGLVGLAFSLSTESFLAPLAEVHSVAAAELQSCLCAEGGSRELGIQYLRAIKSEPECSLYNLYGNPYEKLAASIAAASGGNAQIELRPLL